MTEIQHTSEFVCRRQIWGGGCCSVAIGNKFTIISSIPFYSDTQVLAIIRSLQ